MNEQFSWHQSSDSKQGDQSDRTAQSIAIQNAINELVLDIKDEDETYQKLAPIGEGGFGIIYKVRHLTTMKIYAMKVSKDIITSQ